MAGDDRSFEVLLAEGGSVPVDGWDFAWFDGRATEQRPSWGYARLAAARVADPGVAVVLDLQTGGGEVYAEVLERATLLRGSHPAPAPLTALATEGWPPNHALATRRLAPFGAEVALVEAAPGIPLPHPDASVDLALSRHPAYNDWAEIARVLRPGGRSLSQQVGAGSNRGLYEFLMGPHPVGENDARSDANLAAGARAAGLEVLDLRHESTAVEFFDVAAVVHFLRKVLWTVPDFTVERYRERLRALHAHIEENGSFVCSSERVLLELRRPAETN
ncbi:class I SAM-dependent methyltransferase [Herbiconiux moechotypicola]|uniref:Class I SAM-dependent methyltransferase n=1 Tax=Herbiconiux moechotypicola TaxID=637393 RepID=A0ABP5QFK0_9MICO|nr:class I SAM-dependent methyltransferase [Herbiconiux moechotypicola]MCS5730019.1 class I SAM-dependent methyltransferase [Herbiconiux moechotypicola]